MNEPGSWVGVGYTSAKWSPPTAYHQEPQGGGHAETEEALAPSGSLQLITSPHLSAEGSVSGGSQRSEVVGVLTLQGPRTCDVGRQHLFPSSPACTCMGGFSYFSSLNQEMGTG